MIDNSLLQQISKVLKKPVESIENFDEQQAINIISSTFNDLNYKPVFNNSPIEAIVKLHEEMINRLERLIQNK